MKMPALLLAVVAAAAACLSTSALSMAPARRVTDNATAADALRLRSFPVVIHIPKAGTQFGVTLINAYCDLATWKPVDNMPGKGKSMGSLYGDAHDLMKVNCQQQSANSCPNTKHFCGHMPIRSGAETSKPFVTMLRDANARIASGLLHQLHDCSQLQNKYKCSEHSNNKFACTKLQTFKNLPDEYVLGANRNGTWESFVMEYANCVQACQANMLAGRPCSTSVDTAGAKAEVVAAATKHLRQKAAFVGLTERFNESVDLFQAMFGPPLSAPHWSRHAKNTYRVQQAKTLEDKVTAYLNQQVADGAFAPPDAELLEVAQAWFREKLELYGLAGSDEGSAGDH